MPRKLIDARRPKTDAADWYATPQGRRQTAREFARALSSGALSRSPGLKIPKTNPKLLERLIRQAKENTSRAISIRLPVADLEKAKEIAERTGTGYQTVIKRAIRKGLRKAG